MSKPPTILTPREVGHLFGVDPKTVWRWCVSGRLASYKTLGGHRRILAEDLVALLVNTGMPDNDTREVLGPAPS